MTRFATWRAGLAGAVTLVMLAGAAIVAPEVSAMTGAAMARGGSDDGGGEHGGRGGDDGAGHDAGDDHGGRGRGNADGQDRGDDHGRRHGRGVTDASGSPTTVTGIESSANGIEVTYGDGSREEIANGRYERKDASGRTVEERTATTADVTRLQALQ